MGTRSPPWRCGVAALAGLLLAAPASAANPAPAARAWGFDRSDLQPHPGVRFGVLANGMRYAVMRNAVPAGGLSARLHVGAGATAQGARQDGYMHLIEHLIFEGSANLPRGALLLMLPSQGLQRFADFNAATAPGETLYRLDLAKADARARATVLTVLREVASQLVFDRRTVARAKTAVLAELAGRDTVHDRIIAAQTAWLMPGKAPAGAALAGSAASIRGAGGEALRQLYARTYVPERTTLVLVGDFDPMAAEAEIVARFADWQAQRPLPPPFPRTTPSATAATPVAATPRRRPAGLFVDPAAPTSVVIAAVGAVTGADAVDQRDTAFNQHLAAEMLSRRLARTAPSWGGSASVYGAFGTARIARIDLASPDRDWRRALRIGSDALAAALASGFTQAELDEQLAVSRDALLAAAAPRSHSRLADGIADAVGRGIVFTAAADASAALAYLRRVRLAEVNAAFSAAWSGRERLVFVTHDKAISGGEGAVSAALTEATAAPASKGPSNLH
jgi:zinc protease